MWNLENKLALITGGTKGIGKATVLAFLDAGAKVIFTARNEDEVDAFEKELKSENHEVHGMIADVCEEKDRIIVKSWVEKYWDKLDILVNNAGMNIRKRANDYSEKEYREVLETNLIAPFELSRRMFPYLKKAGTASIINVASAAAIQDLGTGTPYAMSKAGLLQQTRSLAVEWAQDGIRVNAVSPWFTQTPLTEGYLGQEEKKESIINRTPLKRVAKAEEIASIITFMAMAKSSYITGQNIIADGGMSINAI